MNIHEDLKISFESGRYIAVVSDDGDDNTDYRGIVVGLSAAFVALLSVQDWHSDGLQIFPLKRIKRLEHSAVRDEQGEILSWKGVRNFGQYDWLGLSSFAEIFETIRTRKNVVFISSNDAAEVGEISRIEDACVVLRGIDGAGDWIDGDVKFAFEHILMVSVDDEYSRVLYEYAMSEKRV